MDKPARAEWLIGVVGPCGAGKTTLVSALESKGYKCRHIAQEHSYVPHMWKHITNPDFLIFLNASYATCTARRQLRWLELEYEDEMRRLAHARAHADLIIETDGIAPAEVLGQALLFLERARLAGPHADAI